MDRPVMAPPWRMSAWLNTPLPIDLETQRGHIVVACAFQMLCPGCVSHDIPQMKAVHELFDRQGVVVVGLHTVFEYHEAMTVSALHAFVHEYGIRYPIGVDTEHTRTSGIAMRFDPLIATIDQARGKGVRCN